MRTTLILRDDLLETAKKKAAERQTSLSALVNEALLKTFNAPQPTTKETIHIPTYNPSHGGVTCAKTDTPPKSLAEIGITDGMSLYETGVKQ